MSTSSASSTLRLTAVPTPPVRVRFPRFWNRRQTTVFRTAVKHARVHRTLSANRTDEKSVLGIPARSRCLPTKSRHDGFMTLSQCREYLSCPHPSPTSCSIIVCGLLDDRDGQRDCNRSTLLFGKGVFCLKTNHVLACRTAKFGAHPRREEDEYHSVRIPTFRGPSSCQKQAKRRLDGLKCWQQFSLLLHKIQFGLTS